MKAGCNVLSDQNIKTILATSQSAAGAAPIVGPFPAPWDATPFSDPKWDSHESPIQSASVDLHVGKIYVPEKDRSRLGGAKKGATSFTLRPGHSVIVSTYERLALPRDIGAIVLPPSRLSSKGILVANIGHVDPGYEGPLRFTIINMGANDFDLARGEEAVGTLMFFALSAASVSPWAQRLTNAGVHIRDEPDENEINALSRDFAGIERRIGRLAKQTVKKENGKFAFLAFLIPVIVALVLGYVGLIWSTGSSLSASVQKANDKIDRLNEDVMQIKITSDLEGQKKEMHDTVAELRTRLELVEQENAALKSGLAEFEARLHVLQDSREIAPFRK